MSIIDRMPEITRRNFEAMSKIEINIKTKPEVKIENKIERPDKDVTVADITGKEYSFNVRAMVHSMYITNGKSSYHFDIPHRIEVDKETFDSVMYIATGEKFYRAKIKVKPKIEEHGKVQNWRIRWMLTVRKWLSQHFFRLYRSKSS